ncbi:amino acid permease [Streptococcus panodentis]|uniref:Amino acid permease n=1 Tax=Streptococcus panodentis TaxID=1581472 RepID=A0ABS5ATH7_9STRE|nr:MULTISPECIES: amino acid permease [Streptococcus]KXT81259.1 Arginine permease RocE [Streptococcus sp. DD11]MBP2619868.1 amino acid permease [Streptococcus panodentis]
MEAKDFKQEHSQNHNFENEGQFHRKMTSRHLFMLSLGGVIGTGLFLSSGYTIAQAGPLGAVLSYLVGAVVVYLVMLSLGELAVAMPVTGSFHTYATKFISPGTGFAVAWLYWICWTVALGTEFLGAGMLMQRWFPAVPPWIFATIFASVIFGINALSVRLFAEAEFYFSSIKVITIIVFIVLGTAAIFGLIPMQGDQSAPYFRNLTAHGAFPRDWTALLSIMLAVNYAFSGTELIGIAAGETDNPTEAVPQAIKTTIGRLVIFFVLTIIVLAALLPVKEAGVTQAPFVAVFDKIGLPFAADIMNFVILTAILSAGNSGLYASSRMLWSLANEGMISQKVVKINQHGVPMRALLLSMLGAVLALFSSFYAADTVFLALVSIAGFAVVVVWLSIPIAQIRFRREWLKEHKEEDLAFKTPFSPLLPYLTIFLLALSVIGIAWDPSQRAGLYFGVPFVILCYLYYYIRHRKF